MIESIEGSGRVKDLFESIYDNSPIGIELYDSNGKLNDLNKACMQIFGVSIKEDVKDFDLLNDPNIPKEYLIKLRQRETVRFESEFDFDLVKSQNLYETSRTGKIYLDVLITPLFNTDSHEISNYLVQVQEITDRKRIENKLIELNEELENKVQERTKQLNKSEEKFRILVDEAPDIIFTVDRKGNILYINKVPEGMEKEESIGKKALDYVTPEYRQTVENSIVKVFLTGESDSYETAARGPDNNVSWYSTRLAAIKQDKEVVSVMLITRDITERKKMEQNLKKSEEQYRLLVENAQEGFWAIDEHVHTSFVNQRMAEILGYTVDEMIGTSIFNYIDEEGKGLAKIKLDRCRQGIKERYELVINHKDGEKVYVNMATSPIFNQEGNYSGAFTLVSDITLRKKAEQELEMSEAKYRNFIENFQGIAFQGYQDFTAAFFHGEVENITGYREDDFISGRIQWNQIIHPDDISEVNGRVQRYHEGTDNVDKREYRIICKNSKIRWVSEYNKKFFDNFNNKEGVRGIIIDVTESKKIEEEAKQEREKAEMYLNLVNVIIVALDRDGNVSMINKKGNKILGWNEGELVGKNWFANCLPPQDREIVLEYFDQLMNGMVDIIPFYENLVMTRNGEEKLIAWSTILYRDSKGNIKGLLSSGEDITERRRAEEKVRESEKRYTELIEAVPVGISITTPEGKILECNSHNLELFNYDSKEELLRTPVINIYNNASDRETFLDLLEKGKAKNFETQFKRKDGSLFWGSLTSIVQKVGNRITFINSLQDITNRKHDEIMIQQSEAELSAIYNYTPIALLLLDKDRRIRKINNFALNFTDRREEEVFGIHGGEALRCLYSIKNPSGCGFSKQCKKCKIRNTVLDTFKAKNPHINIETTLYLLPGTGMDKVHLLFSTVPLHLDGEDRVLVSMIDITERKKTELELRKIDERLNNLASSGPTVIYTAKAYGDYGATFISENVKDITGYEPEEFTQNTEFWINNVHPDDKDRVLSNLSKIAEKKSLGYEYRFRFKDGIYHWMRDESKIYTNGKGKVSEMMGSWSDITWVKKSEEQLRYQAQLVENVSDAIISTDLDFRIVTWNKAAELIYGWEAKEIIGKKVMDTITVNYPYDDAQTVVKQVFQEGFWKGEVIQPRKDGTLLNILASISLIKDINGKSIGVVAINHDITDRKQAEEIIKTSEKKYKSLADELEMIIDHIPGIVVYKDTKNNILRVNKFMSNAHNLQKEDIEGNSSFDFYPYEEAQAYWEDDLEVIESKSPKLDIIEPWETLQGRRWVNTSKIPIIDENNIAIGIIAIAFDITEKKEMEDVIAKSEQKLKNLMESVPIGISITNSEGRILDINSRASKILEYGSKEELLNIPAAELYQDPKDRGRFLELLIQSGSVNDFEFLAKRQDGSHFWASINSVLQKIGNETLFINSFQNITERKIADQKIRESEEKFRTIAEQSSLGMLIQQKEKIVFANTAISEIIEYPLEEIYRWTLQDRNNIIHQDDLPQVLENSKLRQNGDFTNQYDCRIITKNSRAKWIEVFEKPIKYLEKNAILSTFIDISDKKRAEKELIEISRLKSDLLSRTSHELKTPLVSIKGYADLLLNQHYEELDFYTISIIHEIKQGCTRLEALIKDLIETSKLESGDIELNLSEENLSFLIRFCVRDLRGLVENRDHKLILEIQDELPVLIEKERIYEVIINLLSNAIKYTPPNGIIKIKSERKKGEYLVSVKDNGIGLTKEEISKIFKKFGKIERYGKGLDVVSEGSGLGLYISKRITELHGGKIGVKSKGRNKGSTFTFTIPIKQI
ncbi:MAG: PAS domain S-box protein [Promethearchaeota archaeon]